MHHGVGATTGKGGLDLIGVRQVALNKSCPRIDCAAMAFAQIIKDRDFVAFIQQLFRANTADVTRAASEENFHGRGKCSVIRFESKANRRDKFAKPSGAPGARALQHQSEGRLGEDWATVLPFFFSRTATICRTQRCLQRGARTFRLFSSEPHSKMSMSTWRTPQRFISSRLGLYRSMVSVPIIADP